MGKIYSGLTGRSFHPLWNPLPGPQTQAYESKADELFFGGAAGGGKGQGLDAIVLTPFGWRTMGSLKIGTPVCNPDGTTSTIIAIHPLGERWLYKIKFHDGTSAEVTNDHLWKAWKVGRFSESSCKIWTTKELRRRVKLKTKGNRYRIPITQPVIFTSAGRYNPRPIHPYILGVLLGDGCITKRRKVNFTTADLEIAERIKSLGMSLGKPSIRQSPVKGGKPCHLIHFVKSSRRIISGHLAWLELLGKNSYTKFIPPAYLLGSIQERWELLRGLMDTDGWADLDGDTFYCTTSTRLRDDIVSLARSLGGFVTIHNKQTSSQNGPGEPSFTIRMKFRNSKKAFFLMRKKIRVGRKPQSMGRAIISITKTRKTECQCITIDNPNGLYITNDYIVTHNSSVILGLAITQHRNSLVLRRISNYLKSLAEELQSIVGKDGHWRGLGYGGDMILKNKAIIELRGCEHDKDKDNFQGLPHDLVCVGKGTPVLMANGSYKNVESIIPGDIVQTLIGPKPVTKFHKNGKKQCYRIRCNGMDTYITGTHRFLTSNGWVCPLDLIPKQSHVSCNIEEQLQSTHEEFYKQPSGLSLDSQLDLLNHQQSLLDKKPQGTFSSSVKGRTYFSKSDDVHRAIQKPPLWSGQIALTAPALNLEELDCNNLDLPAREVLSDEIYSPPPDFQSCYHNDYDSCDELSLEESISYQENTPLLICDAQPAQILKSMDDLGSTQTHIQISCQYKYDHPYMNYDCLSSKPVLFHEACIYPADELEVYDLSIHEACHFLCYSGKLQINNNNSIASSKQNVNTIMANCFDEVSHFSKDQYQFIIAWNRNRTSDIKQRCRVVCAGNPPTSQEGRWIIEEWAPWLDSQYPDPAMPGELRWYTNIDGKTVWRKTGDPFYHDGQLIKTKSRTFIPSRLSDNPILASTDYGARLQALPEPLRSQLLYGDMNAGQQDHAWQLIPSSWVEESMAKWTPNPPEGFGLDCIGADIARGGKDKTVISARYGPWFAKLLKYPGTGTPDGPKAAHRVTSIHDNDADINVDVLSIGTSAFDSLKATLGSCVNGINNSEPYKGKDKTGKLKFLNLRAASYWKLREALDPNGDEKIILPNDNELKADLCAVRYEVMANGIKVEKKEDLKDRIGRSPDCGDAVVLSNWRVRKKEFWIG